MKVNVINLKSRPDRLSDITTICKREGLEIAIHEATNGQTKYLKEFDTKRMRGHAGCHNSHVTLLKKIKGTSPYHIILEDDAELIHGFKQKAEHYLSKLDEWTMLYIGGNLNVYDDATEPYNEHFNLAKKVMATHAYIVNDSQIDEILKVIETRIYKIDVMYMDLQQSKDVHITKECLSWQRQTFSDISFQVLNMDTRY